MNGGEIVLHTNTHSITGFMCQHCFSIIFLFEEWLWSANRCSTIVVVLVEFTTTFAFLYLKGQSPKSAIQYNRSHLYQWLWPSFSPFVFAESFALIVLYMMHIASTVGILYICSFKENILTLLHSRFMAGWSLSLLPQGWKAVYTPYTDQQPLAFAFITMTTV